MCCINSVKYLLAMKTEKSVASSDGTRLYQHRLGDCDFLKLSTVKPSIGIPWLSRSCSVWYLGYKMF